MTTKEIQLLHSIVEKTVNRKTGKIEYRNVTKAARKIFALRTGKAPKLWKNKNPSRPTIYKALEMFPEAPARVKRGIPVYVEDFEKSKIVKKITEQEKYIDAETGKLTEHAKRIKRIAFELWMWKGQIDPIGFSMNDFKEAWKLDIFRHKETGRIVFQTASAIRVIMSLSGIDPKSDAYFETKELKPEIVKRGWYLETEEIYRMIAGINEPDTLLLFRIGIETGARFSGIVSLKTSEIHYEQNFFSLYEPKVKKPVEKYVLKGTTDFIRQYVRDFAIIGKLFRSSYGVYLDRLHSAGLRAGLFRVIGSKTKKIRYKGKWKERKVAVTEGKVTSTHLLKHTFVSQCSLHGFDLESASEMTGTDPDTLRKYYVGVGKKKLKAAVYGIIDYEAWWLWIPKFDEAYKKRYAEIRDAYLKVDGLKLKAKLKAKKKEKPKKKRPTNWKSIQGQIDSPKTPAHLKKHWRPRLELHKKGFSDAEIEKRLKK